MYRVHGNTVMYPGSRGPSVRPASLLLLMILIRVLGTSGLPGLVWGDTSSGGQKYTLGLLAYWPRISRISYPYLRLSCAFPIHGRICLCDPPTSTPGRGRGGPGTNHPPRLGSQPTRRASAALRSASTRRARRFLRLDPVRSHTEAQVPRAVRCDQARDSHAQTGDPDAGGRCRRHRRVLGGCTATTASTVTAISVRSAAKLLPVCSTRAFQSSPAQY